MVKRVQCTLLKWLRLRFSSCGDSVDLSDVHKHELWARLYRCMCGRTIRWEGAGTPGRNSPAVTLGMHEAKGFATGMTQNFWQKSC